MRRGRQFGTVDKRVAPDGIVTYRARAYDEGKQKTVGTYETEEEARGMLESIRRKRSTEATPVGMSLLTWGEEWLDRREADGLHRSVKDSRSIFKTHLATWELAPVPMRKLKRTDVVVWVKGLLRKERHDARREVRGVAQGDERMPGVRRRRGDAGGFQGGRVLDGQESGRLASIARNQSGRRLARQTVLNAFNLLHRMLGDAADEGKMSSNVATGVKVPKVPREDEPWTWLRRDEVSALLGQVLTPAQRAIFTVAIYTGLRPGEIFGLRWSDVTATELVVRRSFGGPTKGGRVRRVPLLEPAREALRVWKKHKSGVGNALVFPGEPTARYPEYCGPHHKGFTAEFERVIGRVVKDRPVRFYDLRHTCASNLVQGTLVEGLPAMRLEDVQLWIGHKSRTTTERYAHLCPDRLHGLVRAARVEEEKERGQR